MRLLYCSLLFSAILGTGTTLRAQSLLQSLVSYYKLDTSGNYNDSAGGNNGTVTQGPVGFTTSGRISGAHTFGGFGTALDPRVRATLPNVNSWTGGSFSVWVRPVVYTSNNGLTLLQIEEQGNWGHRWLYINPATRQVIFHIGMGGGSAANIASGITLNDNTWYHIVATWDETAGSGTLYINGVFQGNVSVSGWGTQSNNFYWGAGFNGFGTNGIIDEVGVWNRPLTASEVSTLYNFGSGLSHPFTAPTYSILGTVRTSGGDAVAGVSLGLSNGQSTTSGTNGTYAFNNLANGSYTVTPSLQGFTFAPSSRNITIAGSNSIAADFTRSDPPPPATFSISGQVRTPAGLGIAGVPVTLSNGASTITSGAGNYVFTGLADGMYTIAPSQIGFTFTPVSRTVAIFGESIVAMNFTRSEACAATLSTQSIAAPRAGLTTSVAVTIDSGCAWTAAENLAWVNITSGASGTGPGTVSLEIAANDTGATRSGSVTIAGQVLTINQGACSLSQTSATFSSAAASSEIAISGACAWTASTSASFLTLTGPTSGTAPATVRFSVQAFTGGTNPRTGVITVAGIPFTVTQNPAAACTFTLAPTTRTLPASGGTGRFTVSAGAGCGWNAHTNADWLTLIAGSTGSVDGLVTFQAAPNTGAARTGTIVVADQAFTVSQLAGTGCPATLDPPAATFEGSGSTEAAVRVNSPCSWTAVSNSSFLTVLTGGTGSGPGTVTYRVQAGTASRTGMIIIAGQTFTVTQRAPVCEFSVGAASQTFPSGGGTAAVPVFAAPTCLSQIAVTELPSWLTAGVVGEGQGSRTVTLTAAANTGAERSGTIRIAGVGFRVTQTAAGVFSCRVLNIATPAAVRSEGRTELASDLTLECSGQSTNAVTGDVLVTFNTNFSSKLIGSLTEALLLVNEPGTPQLGSTAIQGVAAGNDAVRFSNVPLALAGANTGRTFRMVNLRLDASLPNLPTDLTAQVSLTVPGRSIAVETPLRMVARRATSLQTTVGTAVAATGGFRVPVTFTELVPNAFRTRAGENGVTVPGNEQIGVADSGTRLVIKLRGLPAGATVSAPLYPDAGQAAQLTGNDGNGAGIGLQTGTGANPLVAVPVIAGEATLTWEILSANASNTEAHTFSIVISDSSNLATRLRASLGPLRLSAQNLARQSVPGFLDPAAPAVGSPAIRPLNATPVAIAPVLSGVQRRAPTGNRTVTLQVTVTCDAPEGCEDPTARGNVSAGSSFQTCEATAAESCTGSGRDFAIDLPRLAQGEAVAATIGAELAADAPDGSLFRYSVRASSGTRTAVNEVEQCVASVGSFPPPVATGVTNASLDVYACGPWTITSPVPWLRFEPASGTGNATITYTIDPNTTGSLRNVQITLPGGAVANVIQPPTSFAPQAGLRFVPITPCRLMDTRPLYAGTTWTGAFGPPILAAGGTRTIQVTASPVCSIPVTARAFVFNLTLDTQEAASGPVDFVTIWPAGEARPNYFTARTSAGGYIANSAIVKAGTNGSVSIFSSNNVHMVLDINGYFTDDAAAPGLLFYPVDPCRAVDTRTAYSTLPPPYGRQRFTGQETRIFRLPGSPGCTLPAAAAYSLQMTIVPGEEGDGPRVDFLTAWPAGQGRPAISNMNAFFGNVAANSGIIPARADGSISVYVNNPTNMIIDVNGYFAPDDGSGRGLSYFPVTQCRAMNTQDLSFTGAYGPPALTAATDRVVRLPGAAGCPGLPTTARAYALNAWVVPNGLPMPFLSMWPAGLPWPIVSQLNAFQGQTLANSAVVPVSANGEINVRVNNTTQVGLEVSGYFARP